MIWHQKEVMVSALAEQGRICQLHIFHEKEKRILGNIYIGKVQNIVKNIHAAFIEIADGISCYYSMDEKSEIFFTNPKKDKTMKIGDEVLVQVSKEGIKIFPNRQGLLSGRTAEMQMLLIFYEN